MLPVLKQCVACITLGVMVFAFPMQAVAQEAAVLEEPQMGKDEASPPPEDVVFDQQEGGEEFLQENAPRKEVSEEILLEPQAAGANNQQQDDGTTYNTGRLASPTTLHVEPDAQTGALTFQYPFALPPGRRGLPPSLALVYNSQNKSNVNFLGYGWSLNIPSIERIARKGIDKLYSENYFYSSLSGEVVPVELTDTTHGTYGAKTETGSFLSYEYTQQEQWIVTNKQGVRYTFGLTPNARHGDSLNERHVYTWMLEEIRDQHNNTVRYEYLHDRGQIYPLRIVYTGHGNEEGMFDVLFSFRDRQDEQKTYNTGFDVETELIMEQVDVRVHGEVKHRYRLAYGVGNNGHRSVLERIVEEGIDAEGNVYPLPPTVFGYTNDTVSWDGSDRRLENIIPYPFVKPGGSGIAVDTGLRMIDINGDGMLDFLHAKKDCCGEYINSQVYVSTPPARESLLQWNSGRQYADMPVPITDSGLRDYGTRIVDVNGDGFSDLLLSQEDDRRTIRKVFINNGENGWQEDPEYSIPLDFVRMHDSPYPRSQDLGTRVLDINTDGLVDLVYARPDNERRVYLNKGDGTGWEQSPFYHFPRDVIPRPSVQMVDVNGDGLLDVLDFGADVNGMSHLGSQYVLINQGDGTWSRENRYVDIPPYGFDHQGAFRIAEVNGDGLPDLLFYREGRDQGVYLNKGDGRGWEQANIIIPGMVFVQSTGEDMGVRLADVNGDGLTDILRTMGPGSNSILLNTSKSPDLLASITHTSGAHTMVSYRPTTAYKTANEFKNAKLPIVLETVETIARDDGLGHIATTTYDYEGGEYFFHTPYDRRFAGFKKVTTTDPQGNSTIQYFHQGNDTAVQLGEYLDDGAKINMVYREELFDTQNRLYVETIHTWDKADLNNERSFVFLSRKLIQTYDGNQTHRDKAESFVYDESTGNLTQHSRWGEVRGDAEEQFEDVGDDRYTTQFVYAQPYEGASEQLFGFVAQETVRDTHGGIIRESRLYYDNLPYGEVRIGNPTLKEVLIEGDRYARVQTTYNEYGLPMSETDPNGNITRFIYDETFLSPVEMVNSLGHTVISAYDYRFGKPVRITDPNGGVSETVYDVFGRMIEERQPDVQRGQSVVKTRIVYEDNTMPRSTETFDYLDQNNSIRGIVYTDGFDRVIQQRREAEEENQFIVVNQVYNNRGLKEWETLPYMSADAAYTSPTEQEALRISYEYDARGLVTQTRNIAGVVNHVYDEWAVTITDQNGGTKTLHTDAYDRLVGVDEHNGDEIYHTGYTYNGNGNLVEMVDAQDNIRQFTYDKAGNRTAVEDLHHSSDDTFGVYSFVYDDSGNMLEQTDPTGQIITMRYDVLNRLIEERYTQQQESVSTQYAYDACKNGVGLLCRVVADRVTIVFEYDALGRVAQELRSIDLIDYITRSVYNRQGNVVSITYPDGVRVEHAYNTAGMLTTIVEDEHVLVSSIDYHPLGMVSRLVYGNGAVTENIYDPNEVYRLRQKRTLGSNGGRHFQDMVYIYDPVGNIIRITDTSDTLAAKVGDYTYDGVYRLVEARVTNTANNENYTHTYRYDAIGNIVEKSDQGRYVYEGGQDGNYANPHAVTQIGDEI